MSKYKSLLRRERIAAVANAIAAQLVQSLDRAGIAVKVFFKQSKRTGSVYLKIKVLDAAGEKMKDYGAAIRISDHRQLGSRRVNFSRPSRRFYGICSNISPWQIVGKVNRIGRSILDRTQSRKGGEA